MTKKEMGKLLWKYLKEDKIKLYVYIFLVLTSYIPVILTPYFWGSALECLIVKDTSLFTFYLVCWSATALIFNTIFQIPRKLLYNYLEYRFAKNVSVDLFQKTLDLPAIAFEDYGVGEFINRLYTDPDRVIELLSKLITMICKIFIVFLVIIVSFSMSIVLGIEIIIFSIIMGGISRKFFPKIKKVQEKIKKQSDAYVKDLTENITGIREIKALGIKKNIASRVNLGIDDLFTNTKKINRYETFYYSANNCCYYILQFIILLTCAYLFIEGKTTYSAFIMLSAYIWRIDDVVESISDFGVNYNKVAVSLKRINELLNNKLYKDEYFGTKENINKNGKIEFKNVLFKYRNEEDETLKGLSLTLNPNKKIAIVGRSGNGKSTIFNLLLRYFNKNSGEILLDNIPIEELSEESLRSQISIIRQSPFLFNLTLFENFKMIKEDVTLEEVREVCKKAYIDEYIMTLPKKYDTVIGEGGVNLSGGQKQRVAIARTLLLNTNIILFDEATSALDNESQEYIKQTIDDLVVDHTIIIVAHRLSTIVDADVIHIIEKGKLAGSGKHEELLKTNKTYQKLYNIESLNS